MIYSVFLRDFRLNARVGILPNELESSQKIILNIEILYEKKNNYILDYAALHRLICDIFLQNRFDYLESCLEYLFQKITSNFKYLKKLNIEISKPEILLNCTPSVRKEEIYD